MRNSLVKVISSLVTKPKSFVSIRRTSLFYGSRQLQVYAPLSNKSEFTSVNVPGSTFQQMKIIEVGDAFSVVIENNQVVLGCFSTREQAAELIEMIVKSFHPFWTIKKITLAVVAGIFFLTIPFPQAGSPNTALVSSAPPVLPFKPMPTQIVGPGIANPTTQQNSAPTDVTPGGNPDGVLGGGVANPSPVKDVADPFGLVNPKKQN